MVPKQSHANHAHSSNKQEHLSTSLESNRAGNKQEKQGKHHHHHQQQLQTEVLEKEVTIENTPDAHPDADPAIDSATNSNVSSTELEEGEIDVLHEDMYLETHPLNTCWTMYYTQPGKAKVWSDSIHKVFVVTTVEEFWGLFQCIPSLTDIASGSDYNFFREDIFPAWEHEKNKQGGRWSFSSNNPDPSIWLNSCLFLIGETFEDPNEICGLVISIRRSVRASLWTKTAADKEKTIKLGKAWKKAMGLPDSESLQYEGFFDTSCRYTV